MKSNRIAMLSEKIIIKQQQEQEQWMDIRLPELPNEIWVEIMCKLAIKPLHVCKCVSKTWHSYVSHILSCQKGLDDLPHGVLYFRTHFLPNLGDPDPDPDPSNDKDGELSYLSLADYNVTRWSSSDDPKAESGTVTMTDLPKDFTSHKGKCMLSSLLGNLTVDFGCLIPPVKRFSHWAMHRGLVVLSTTDPLGFHVYNPATRENFVLPTPPSFTDPASGRVSVQASIINLSDCLLSTHCNFRVIRFPRKGASRWAEIYSSNNNQWCQSQLCIDKDTLAAEWHLAGAVFLDDTLFFFTHRRLVVGVKFLFLSGEQVISGVYTLLLPPPIRYGMSDATLYGSQGCLYLCHCKRANLWIWKHNGSSLDDKSWIPQLIFKKSGMSLCQPIAEKHLRQIVGTKVSVQPMIIHPEAPVVFIQMKKSIFAFHLLNDTVEKIVELRERTVVSAGYVYIYSPCFASLERLKHRNQPRDTPRPPESAQPSTTKSCRISHGEPNLDSPNLSL